MDEVIGVTVIRSADLKRFDKIETFGRVGGLTLCLVREQNNTSSPIRLVLVGGMDGIATIQSFRPEKREIASIIGVVTLRALEAAHSQWVD